MKLSNLGNTTSFIEEVDNKIKDQDKMWFKTRKLFMIFILTSNDVRTTILLKIHGEKK